jgi:hypothetical protein
MAALFSSIPQTLVDYARANEPELNEIESHHIRLMMSLCVRHYFSPKRFRHKLSSNAFYIPYEKLQGVFGRKYLDLFARSGLIHVAIEANKAKKITRGYALTEKATALLDEFYETPTGKTKMITNTNPQSHSLRKRKSTGEYFAIMSRDTAGNMATCKEQINAVTDINLPALERLRNAITAHKDRIAHNLTPDIITNDYRAIKAQIAGKTNKASLDWLQYRLKNICLFIYDANVNDKLVTGQIVQQYEQCKTGRLYGFGVHLQNAPKEVRKAAFQGCYDYDFNNCHFAIASQLAARIGIETPHIYDYLVNKPSRRHELSKLLGKPIADVKKCLISLIYGSCINLHSDTAIVKAVGKKAAGQLVSNEFYKGLYDDIRKAKKGIIEQHRGKGGLFNSVGKKLKPDDDIDPLSFIIQGYEARMLEIAMRLYGSNIVLLQHDGFTTNKPVDKTVLIAQIQHELDLEISVSFDKL